MQTVWVVGNASDIQKFPTDLSAGYFTFGGSVYGDYDNPPQVNEQFDHDADSCPASGEYPTAGGWGGEGYEVA